MLYLNIIMECIICFEKKWLTTTDCNHIICISCLFEIQKDECPYCRKKLFTTFPTKLKSLLKVNNQRNKILDIHDSEQFPSLG